MPPSPINKHKSIVIIIGVALCAVFLMLYFAPCGIQRYLKVREDLTLINKELDELKQKNQELTDEITLLKTDTNYVEKIARQKLGMLKKNEILFEVPEKKSKRE